MQCQVGLPKCSLRTAQRENMKEASLFCFRRTNVEGLIFAGSRGCTVVVRDVL